MISEIETDLLMEMNDFVAFSNFFPTHSPAYYLEIRRSAG